MFKDLSQRGQFTYQAAPWPRASAKRNRLDPFRRIMVGSFIRGETGSNSTIVDGFGH
jgi:hypothetical protein